MNKCKSETHNIESTSLSAYLRIKDRQGHFLGEIQGSVLRIYCRRCKEFFEVPIDELVVNNRKGL